MVVHFNACPGCGGAVLETKGWDWDEPYCINCGWRRQAIPDDVLAQVVAHIGEFNIEQPYIPNQIGTGKPPPSGWERLKRRRERQQKTDRLLNNPNQ